MAKLSRRDFTALCGGALAAGGLMASWPLGAEAESMADDKLTALRLGQGARSRLCHP